MQKACFISFSRLLALMKTSNWIKRSSVIIISQTKKKIIECFCVLTKPWSRNVSAKQTNHQNINISGVFTFFYVYSVGFNLLSPTHAFTHTHTHTHIYIYIYIMPVGIFINRSHSISMIEHIHLRECSVDLETMTLLMTHFPLIAIIYIYIYLCVCIYIYIYIYMENGRAWKTQSHQEMIFLTESFAPVNPYSLLIFFISISVFEQLNETEKDENLLKYFVFVVAFLFQNPVM